MIIFFYYFLKNIFGGGPGKSDCGREKGVLVPV